ncbi:12007_t:CDS:2 [Diversispora eburnea]|uniref:12007_t:CDS:1 n=1 Tax=Diversispora eburnea TaxID=1213867 RepID=A0A9N8V9Q9_9GLOM|nr:12007_t:CDS:2 [Diversispora eburnea]
MSFELPRIILNKIFLYLSNGHAKLPDLHSCLLVNKNWSNEAVRLLWSKPFYYTNHASLLKIIDVYLNCLYENDREELIEVYKFPLNVDFRKPYYPYASYHRHIYYRTLISLVDRWCGTYSPSGSKNPWFYVLMKKLIKLFEKNSEILERKLQRTLYLIETDQGVGFGPPRNVYLIQKEAMEYITDIDRIWFGLYTETNAFLQELGKRYTNVEHFGVFMQTTGSQACHSTAVAEFIKRQNKLQTFQSIYLSPTSRVINSLELQANSLRFLDFICSNFFGCAPLERLTKCKNLEVLRFRYCCGFTSEIGEPIFTTTFPKIKDVTVLKTDCPELIKWAKKLMKTIYPAFVYKEEDTEVDYFGTFNSDLEDDTLFDLNHVKGLMLYELICLICLKLCTHPVTTSCGHTFCNECLTNYMTKNEELIHEDEGNTPENSTYFWGKQLEDG